MKYFITGGSGFIGGELVKQLTAEGHECVVLIRNPDKAKDALKNNPKVTLHKGDIVDKESMRSPMEGCDGVFHLAAWFKLGAPSETKLAEATNVGGTRNVLELMKEFGIKKGVYTSTLAVNSDTKGEMVDESYEFKGKHITVYDRTKWEAHYEVALPMMQEGLPLVIVMPGVVYGVGDTGPIHDMFADYLQKKMPGVPKGSAFCYAHVEDVVRGHILAMDKGNAGESYIIAGPEATIQDTFRVCESITGVKAPAMQFSPVLLKTMAAVLTPVSYVVSLPFSMEPEALRAIAGTTYIATNAKAKRELGYNPRSMEEGFKEMLDYEMKVLNIKT